MSLPGGAGVLLTREIEHAELGTHAGRRLRGRVERRVLRLGAGGARTLRLELGRRRPVAVEVEERGGHRYHVPIEAPPDPWLQMARRTALGGLLAVILGWWLAGTRGGPNDAMVGGRDGTV